MKKHILFFAFLSISFFGISQEVIFTFNITETTNNNDGSIEARVSGVFEGTEPFCIKQSTQEEMPIDNFYYDFGTDEFVIEVNNLNEDDYLFRVDFEGQTFEESVHLNTTTQTNPLTTSFTVVNQKGSNLGQITAVITTGNVEPDVSLFNASNTSQTFSSSVYNATNNTLTVVAQNLHSGVFTLTVDDGTFNLNQSTTVQYEVVSLAIDFDVIHVLEGSDASVTANILGGTNGSSVTLNKHGNSNPISFTSTFSQAVYQKTIIANNLDEGVYELHVHENGLDAYSYVWVGKYGETTTLFVQPDGNFGIDALLNDYTTKPGYAYVANTNYGDYVNILARNGTSGSYTIQSKEVIKFNYHGLDKANIDNAKLNLYGWLYRNQGQGGGYGNEVFVKRIDNNSTWNENTVTWNTQPIAVNTNQALITQQGATGTSATSQYNKEVTITDLISDQLNPLNINNGLLLELGTNYRYRRQFFYSSDYSVELKRPKLTLSFTLPDQKQLVNLSKKLDGGFTTLDADRKLRFIYKEEYKDSDEKLTYSIYNEMHKVVMADILNTDTDLEPNKRLDVLNIKNGQNTVVLDIDCCLSCDEYFILEVINEKNEKWYLRFKTAPAIGGESQCHPCSTNQSNCGTAAGGNNQ